PTNFFFERVNNEIEDAVRAAIERLEEAGAKLRKIAVPMAAEANENGRTVLLVEAVETHRKYARRRAEYGDAVRLLLEKGDTITPAQFRAAKKAVNIFKREFAKIWANIDA